MNGLLFVAWKEIRLAFCERIIVFLCVVIILLLGFSLFAGFKSYQLKKEILINAQNEKREEWHNHGDKHPLNAAHYGAFALKPKTILSLFGFIPNTYTGISVYSEAHNEYEFKFRPVQDYSSIVRYGELSTSMVMQVLLPLLVIFLAFSSYIRERKSRTLKLMMSQGVSAHAIIWGRALAYGTILLIILLPFFIGLVLMAGSAVNIDSIPDVGRRSVLLIGAYATYLFLVVAITVYVSMRLTGRNALLALLTGWAFFVILMPKTVANLGEGLYPLPAIEEFKAQIEESKRNGLDGKTPPSVRMEELEKEYLRKYGVGSIERLPFNFNRVSVQAEIDYDNRIYDYHLEGIRTVFKKQDRLSSIAGVFNPLIATQRLSMSLSGTDFHAIDHFEREVEDYRRMLVKQMNNDTNYGEFHEYDSGMDPFGDTEGFAYQVPTFQTALKPYYLELISLMVWVVFVILLLNSSSKRLQLAYG